MANIVPDSFKTDLLGGVFDFDSGGSTFKLALYTSLAGFSLPLLLIQLPMKYFQLEQIIRQVVIL